MEFEVREITETVSEDAGRMADVAVGAAAEVAEAAVHPIGTVKKQVRRLQRKGQPIKRSLERDMDRAAESTYDVVSGALPERFALAGIRVIKSQARRKDFVGDVAYQTLKLMNAGLERALRTLNRFENASEPPAREGRRGSRTRRTKTSTTRTSAARTRRSGRRSGATTRSSARRTVRQGRTTARRTAAAIRRSA